MFDSFVRAQTAPAYPQTIYQQRAPTDESVRLHREYEERAQQAVVEKIGLTLGDINIAEVVVTKDYFASSMKVGYTVVFKLNGRTVSAVVPEPNMNLSPVDTRRQLQVSAVQVIATVVAKELSALVLLK